MLILSKAHFLSQKIAFPMLILLSVIEKKGRIFYTVSHKI